MADKGSLIKRRIVGAQEIIARAVKTVVIQLKKHNRDYLRVTTLPHSL